MNKVQRVALIYRTLWAREDPAAAVARPHDKISFRYESECEYGSVIIIDAYM